MSLTTVAPRADESWIGLYKQQSFSTDPSPSAQYWLDGSTSTFRRWEAGEPNNTTYCVLMEINGEFKDEPCNNQSGFVCKRTGGSYCRDSAHIAVRNLIRRHRIYPIYMYKQVRLNTRRDSV